MIRPSLTVLTCIASALHHVAAAPTWPSSIDELEDIQLLNTGYRARGFSVAVTPCSFSAQGVGRIAAAEWIRTAFHDMATGSVFTGVGGLDASLQYELAGDGGENIGPAFNTTLTTFSPFMSSRSSMADIIAMGVYTAVRSCGGPVVAIKAGRVDAKAAGPIGVPLPQNSLGTFQNQFLRTGFNTTEMIAVAACGHTLGGVHAANFPQIVTPGNVTNDFQHFDSTTVFDEKIASEYSSGVSTDPLVVGPSIASGRNSDAKVFGADGNATIKAMANPATFASLCSTMLQKMIEVVPSGTVLTAPITPYEVKPGALQLTLLGGGTSLSFKGEIRVRTTVRPASQIASVQLVYKDRSGGSGCDSCTISTTLKGTAAGFDNSFTFYGFSSQLASLSSISAFNVLVTLTSSATELYDNNGAGFPVQDTIMLQSPQSCLSSTTDANGKGNLTIVAAVGSTAPAGSVTLTLTLKVRRSGLVVPGLQAVSVAMTQQSTVGSYNLYAGTYALDPTLGKTTKFAVSTGTVSDSFKNTDDLETTCTALGSNSSSSTYTYQGCYTDSVAQRAFTGAASDDSAMTIEKCAASCSSFLYLAVEFGRECYCGNQRDPSSAQAGESDCNMACPGNSQEICGAGNRLSVYKNLQYVPVTNPTIPNYTYQGCYNDSVTARALAGGATTSDTLTVESCATFCNGAAYFGVEYGRECYCGASLGSSSTKQPDTDCSYICTGNGSEYCGAGDRLNLYRKGASSSSSSTTSSTTTSSSSKTTSSTTVSSSSTVTTSSTTTSSSTSSTPTPTISGYDYQGCYTDSVTARVLTGKTTANSGMSYSSCADTCAGYTYFGVEYGAECYCGDAFSNPTSQSPSSDCSFSCAGDPTEVCGGAARMNLFKNNNPQTGASNPTIAGYAYAGCHTDAVAARVLTASFLGDNAMTVEKCATFCKGYTYFGTEYGVECYCGNAFANPTNTASEADCSFLCGGSTTELCGAGTGLSLYTAG